MLAIWKREVQSYFLSPIAYIFIGAFTLITGIMFIYNNIRYMNVSFNSTLGSMTFIFMLLVPILTMKLISEDRKTKTDQLLLTAPVKLSSIVLGKYLAAISVFFVTLVITFVFPIILSIFGMPSFGEIVAGYIGFFLLGSALISVGLFISSVTENQVISALMTFFALLFIYIGASAISTASVPDIPVVKQVIEFFLIILNGLMVYTRMNYFSIGIVSLSPLLYFFTFIIVFLYLTMRNIERRRWSEG